MTEWHAVEVDNHIRPMFGEDVTATVVPYRGNASLDELFEARDALTEDVETARRVEQLEITIANVTQQRDEFVEALLYAQEMIKAAIIAEESKATSVALHRATALRWALDQVELPALVPETLEDEHERLGAFLEELEAKLGPVDPDLLAEARHFFYGDDS